MTQIALKPHSIAGVPRRASCVSSRTNIARRLFAKSNGSHTESPDTPESRLNMSLATTAAAVVVMMPSFGMFASPALAVNKDITVNSMMAGGRDKRGFKDVYETRGQELPETPRKIGSGDTRFVFDNKDAKSTQKRAEECLVLLQKKVPKYIEDKAWAKANGELRNQLQTLRYDLDNLAMNKGLKRASNKTLFQKLDSLDFNVRSKNQDKSLTLAKEVAEGVEARLKELKV